MRALVLFLLLAVSAHAALLERDLGLGLVYYRVHQLPADLPPEAAPAGAVKKPRAVVLDLRYSTANAAGVFALDTWLKAHAGAASPVILLLNRATPRAVTRMLAARDSATGLVAIGTPSPDFDPDIQLPAAPEAERAAYDALEHGTAIDALLNDAPEKIRHDEAELAESRRSPAPVSDDSDDYAPPAPEPAPAAPRLIDRPLQRAVQLHRALLALRKIPAA
ncbi:MAG: hypothetical protein JSS11_10010 [Verrucomicrobia bacterium]|nr:hypothetical protein [Verrucomicrobiota bacterium]